LPKLLRSRNLSSCMETIMRGPKPLTVELTDEQRQALQSFIRRHTASQQLVLRAQIILHAADGLSNTAIAAAQQVTLDMVRIWRERWMLLQPIPLAELGIEDRLSDAPRSGKPSKITAEQICAIVAMACEAPSQSGRPITHWTQREIADEVIKRGIVDRISPRHAARILKNPGPQTASGPALAEFGLRRAVRDAGHRRLRGVPRRAAPGRAIRPGRQHG
jgi:putative transposase